MNNGNNQLAVQWTNPALQQVQQMTPAQCQGMDPKTWHEQVVRMHAAQNVPQANRARIRKVAHSGGTIATEPNHITVTYKANNHDLGAWHVYA